MATAVGQYVPTFSMQPNRFTLHNSTPEEISIRWAGLQFTIPPVDVIGVRPAVDADGDKIPGTYVVEDGYAPTVDGSLPKGGQFNWFASEVIKHALGINPDTGAAESSYAFKGISFLPVNPTKEQIKNITASGKDRYASFLVEWAQYEVAAQQQAVERASRAGHAPPPPSKDYGKALTILQRHQKIVEQSVGAVTEQLSDSSDLDNIKFRAWAMAEAMKLAESAAAEKQVDKRKLAESMLEDKEVLQHLRRQYRIRKIGHLPEEESGE